MTETEKGLEERVVELVVWLLTIGGVGIWTASIVAEIPHAYLVALVCLGIGLLLADWMLAWGTNEERFMRVQDRRIIVSFLALAFFARVWSLQPTVDEAFGGRGALWVFVASCVILGLAVWAKVALVVKEDGWHLAGALGNERTLVEGPGSFRAMAASMLRAYPARLAGPAESWRRRALVLVVTTAAGVWFFAVSKPLAFSGGVLITTLALITAGLPELIQHWLWARD